MNQERSTGLVITALLAAAVIGLSMALPWFEYDYSSSRKVAPGGFHGDDPQTERHSLTYAPFRTWGDVEPTHPADGAVLGMGVAAVLGMALLVVVGLADLPGLPRLIPRRVGLALLTLALAATGTALAIAWYVLPSTLEGYGITGPFTYPFDYETGYYRSTLWWGWASAALAVPLCFGALLFKFQTGIVEIPTQAKPAGGPA